MLNKDFDARLHEPRTIRKKGSRSHLCALLAAILSLVFASTISNAASGKIIIDGNLPLSGPIAAFSGQYPNGFAMGIDDGCKEYAVPRDTFKIDFQDNGGKPAQAVSILRKHFMEQPNFYISGVSPESLVIASEISKQGIPHIMVAFDAYICSRGPNRLRILPHYKIEGPVYVEYAVDAKSIRKVLPYHGFSGDIAVDREGDLTTRLYVAQVDKDGKVRFINE